ncbi:MAG: 1,4-dihydroxy-6-naphthoate synthase [Planctomycetota bacterium]
MTNRSESAAAAPSSLELPFGMSPCPNDTFAFWAALHDRVQEPGVRLVAGAMEDIEALNRRALAGGAGGLAVTKLSLPALAARADRYAVLSAGAALGFGCGPLLVRRAADDALGTPADLRGRRVAVPGRNTTAFLLCNLLAQRDCEFVTMPFEQVMPAVARGDCDAGAIIHESRFTYRDHGLLPICDLGELWERATGGPLPLGVIAARRELGRDVHERLGALLRESVRLARRHPEWPREFVRRHARELDDEVQRRHIALYVNDFTEDLGPAGRAAIDVLLQRGRAAGLLAEGPSPWWEAA